MREPLQNSAPNSYERPNQPWVCGLASEGHACPAGPMAGGGCPALAECTPSREGDRWQCNRSPLRGGPCDDGPTPDGECACINRCQPARSLRTRRGRFVIASALATAGALALLLSADHRDRLISPGPLAAQHAQLLEPADSPPQCAACHTAADSGPLGWSISLVDFYSDTPTQSQLCMNCHAESIDTELALVAHNLPPDELAELTFARTPNAKPRGPAALACAACHHEHQGNSYNLAAIDNNRCQACHQERYHSFADDHPDFGAWPYQRRTRIIFDHAAHQAKHFPKEKRSFDCQSCHLDDATGNVQLTAGYDAACASCHDDNIRTSVAQGVPMFALPTLDAKALWNAGINIGRWPEGAIGDFDGRLPPLMKLLLAADPAAQRVIKMFGPDFELLDLDPTNPDDLRAAGDLAVAIQKLLSELARSPTSTLRKRLRFSLGREVSQAEAQSLAAGLSVDIIRSAVDAWQLVVEENNEFAMALSAKKPPTAEPQNLISEPSYDPAGAWQRDDATFTIRYHPSRHADPVLASWLAAVADAPDDKRRPLARSMLKELAKPTAPGQCASCHSIDRIDGVNGDRGFVHWRALDRSSEPRSFTKFAHGPHLVLPQLADCTACHAIDPSASTASSYADFDPHSFASEFQPISKRTCSECHTHQAAGDSCQSCHNYHVGEGTRGD